MTAINKCCEYCESNQADIGICTNERCKCHDLQNQAKLASTPEQRTIEEIVDEMTDSFDPDGSGPDQEVWIKNAAERLKKSLIIFKSSIEKEAEERGEAAGCARGLQTDFCNERRGRTAALDEAMGALRAEKKEKHAFWDDHTHGFNAALESAIKILTDLKNKEV